MSREVGNERGELELGASMMPLSLVRHVASALVSLLGYPRTIGHELRGRMLG